MIGADQFHCVAVRLAEKRHAAVGSDVFHLMDLAIECARQDHRMLANQGALEVPRGGNFGFQADIRPVPLVKQALEFFFVVLGLGIEGEGHAVGVVALRMYGWFNHEHSFDSDALTVGRFGVLKHTVFWVAMRAVLNQFPVAVM